MVRMVGVKLALLTVHYVTIYPTILTSHYIMLQFLPPRIHCLLKAFESCQEIGLVGFMFFFELLFFLCLFTISFYVFITDSFSFILFLIS